jgi:hypothetical protein
MLRQAGGETLDADEEKTGDAAITKFPEGDLKPFGLAGK